MILQDEEDLKSWGCEQVGATSLWHTVHQEHVLTSLTACKVDKKIFKFTAFFFLFFSFFFFNRAFPEAE